MMKAVLSAVTALCLGGGVSAAVIYDNGATVNNATASDSDFPFFLADNFVLQQGANTISDVHWTGIYAFDNIPSATDSFTIQLFADSGGLPADHPAQYLQRR